MMRGRPTSSKPQWTGLERDQSTLTSRTSTGREVDIIRIIHPSNPTIALQMHNTLRLISFDIKHRSSRSQRLNHQRVLVIEFPRTEISKTRPMSRDSHMLFDTNWHAMQRTHRLAIFLQIFIQILRTFDGFVHEVLCQTARELMSNSSSLAKCRGDSYRRELLLSNRFCQTGSIVVFGNDNLCWTQNSTGRWDRGHVEWWVLEE